MDKKEIRTLGSQLVYSNRWMKLREDTVVRPSGATGIFGVVEKPDFAVIAAVENGCIHLVEQYRYPVAGRYWELPQGSWETQDVDPLVLAAAELREETGLVAGSMRHVGHLFLACGYSTQGYDVFLASQLEQVGNETDPEEEGLVSRAFELDRFEQMIREGIVKDATTVAAYGLLRLHRLL